jgi:hypothetical protein
VRWVAQLRTLQQGLADKAVPGKGNPPPIIPPHVFNPVLSLAGIPQVWYSDEPTGGWPAASLNQTPGDGRVSVATSPLTAYWVDKAVYDAMTPQAIDPAWAATFQRMKEQAAQGNPPPPPAEPAPAEPGIVEA